MAQDSARHCSDSQQCRGVAVQFVLDFIERLDDMDCPFSHEQRFVVHFLACWMALLCHGDNEILLFEKSVMADLQLSRFFRKSILNM
jgi:hypothetical protein